MYSSPRLTVYGSIPWFGPDSTSLRFARDFAALAGTFFRGATALAAGFFFETFFATFFLPGDFRAGFFFTAFFLPGFFRDAFFLPAVFFATFFLLTFLRVAAFLRPADFFDDVLADFFAVFLEDFFATDFFRATGFFFVEVFFLLTLRFLAVAFLRLDALREAAFLAAISNSCRSGKGGNYTLMAATWKPRLAPFSGHFQLLLRVPIAGGDRTGSVAEYSRDQTLDFGAFRVWLLSLSYCCDNRFIAKIALHFPL